MKRKAERSDAKVAEKTDGNGCPVPRAKPGGYKANRKSTAKSGCATKMRDEDFVMLFDVAFLFYFGGF